MNKQGGRVFSRKNNFPVCDFYDNQFDKVYSEKRKRAAESGERERKKR